MRKDDNLEKKHLNRIENTRVAETRENYKRQMMNMKWKDPLYVNPEYIPEGYECLWVRESIHDRPDTTNLVNMRRMGWEPASADRYPDMVFDDYFGRLSHMKGYVYRAGLILCERPKELGDMEREVMARENERILTSMPGTEHFMGEPSIPVRDISSTERKYAVRVA
jgi:hypothetical protein